MLHYTCTHSNMCMHVWVRVPFLPSRLTATPRWPVRCKLIWDDDTDTNVHVDVSMSYVPIIIANSMSCALLCHEYVMHVWVCRVLQVSLVGAVARAPPCISSSVELNCTNMQSARPAGWCTPASCWIHVDACVAADVAQHVRNTSNTVIDRKQRHIAECQSSMTPTYKSIHKPCTTHVQSGELWVCLSTLVHTAWLVHTSTLASDCSPMTHIRAYVTTMWAYWQRLTTITDGVNESIMMVQRTNANTSN